MTRVEENEESMRTKEHSSQKSEPQATTLVEVCAMPRFRRYSTWVIGIQLERYMELG